MPNRNPPTVAAGMSKQIVNWLNALPVHHHIVAFDLSSLSLSNTDISELLKAIEKIDSSLIADFPESKSLTTAWEHSSFFEAKSQIMKMDDWLSTDDIFALSQVDVFNPNHSISSPDDWIGNREIFSLVWNGETFFPAYGLTAKDGSLMPLPVMKEVLLTLDHFGVWAIAGWFASPNSFLGGHVAPKDLIESDPARIIAAANDAAIGIQHG